MLRFHRSMVIHQQLAEKCERSEILRPLASDFRQLEDVDRDAYTAFETILGVSQGDKSHKEENVKTSTPRIIIILTLLAMLLGLPGFIVIAQVESDPTAELTPDPGIPSAPVVITVPSSPIDSTVIVTLFGFVASLGFIAVIFIQQRDHEKFRKDYILLLDKQENRDNAERAFREAALPVQQIIQLLSGFVNVVGSLNLLPTNVDAIVDKTGEFLNDVITPNQPLPGATPPLQNFSQREE